MERKLLKRFRTITVFVSFLFGLVFAACEIGLGASVDTEPPTLTITYPSADVVIRDAFVLAGSCNDDEALDTVTVLLKETATNTSYGPFEIQIPEREEGDKSAQDWKIWLNQKDNGLYPFKDGRYVAEVYATDKSGKVSGKSSLSFDIDNTAPIFVVQTPVAIDLTQPTEFGSSVKANGRIADDHTISKMVMKVYDASANFDDVNNPPVAKYEFTETEVETAGGTSVVFAKYTKSEAGSTDISAKSGRYNVLNNGQPWFCSIEVVDAAKTYTQSESDATSEGNSTGGAMYRYDDVYDVWLSAACGLDTTAVKQIVNGTYSGTASAASIEAAKNAYEKSAKSNVCFSVNPVVNPKYTCFGYTVGNDFETAKNNITPVSGDSQLSVNVTCGLDGTLLNPDTTKIYVFGPYLETELDNNKIKTIYADPTSYASSNSGKIYEQWIRGGVNSDVLKASGSTESFTETVTLPKEIVDGSFYILATEVYDVEGSRSIPEKWIIFKGHVEEKDLVIEWLSPSRIPDDVKSGYATCDGGGYYNYNEGKDLLFYGYLSGVLKEKASNASMSYSIDNGAAFDVDMLAYDDSVGKIPWKFILHKANFANVENADDEYSFSIEVDATLTTDDGGSKPASPVTKLINIDYKKPKVSFSSISPTVADSSDPNKTYINGEVTIKGSIEEAHGIEELTYVAKQGNSERKHGTITDTNEKKNNFTLALNTANGFTDKSEVEVIIYAKDIYGNVGELSTTEDNGNRAYIINQSSDMPTVALTNGDIELTRTAIVDGSKKLSVKNSQNVFGTSANNSLNLLITDDDGIQSVKVIKAGVDITPSGFDPAGKTSVSLVCPLGITEGEFTIKVEVQDTKNATSYAKNDRTEFEVAVDHGAPKVGLSTSNGTYKTGNTSILIEGTTDKSDCSIEVFAENPNGSENPAALGSVSTGDNTAHKICGTITQPGADKKWRFNYNTVDNGEKSFFIKITDKYDQSSSEEFTYIVDKMPPTFTLDKVNGKSLSALDTDENGLKIGFGSKNTLYTIEGSVTDPQSSENPSSGLPSTFYYTLVEANASAPSYAYDDITSSWNSTTITKLESKNAYTIAANLSDLTESASYILYLAAVDNAGNVSLPADNPTGKVKVTVDSNGPTLSAMSFDSESKELSLPASDNSGLSEIVIKNNGKTIKTLSGSDLAGNDIKYVIPNSDVGDGVNEFTFEATDKAGNVSKSADKITIENNAPEFSTKNDGLSGLNTVDGYSYLNASHTAKDASASVTANGENNALASVLWEDTYKGGTSALASGTCEPDSTGAISTSLVPATDKTAYEGKLVTRTVTATNIYGLKSTWTIKFVWDTEAPVIITESSNENALSVGGKLYTAITADGADIWFNSKSLNVKGAYAESNSGINNKVSYSVGSTTGDISVTNYAAYGKFDGTISGFEEGDDNTLTLRTSDKAGNDSALTSFTVKVDTSAPTLSNIEYKYDGEDDTAYRPYSGAILTNKSKNIFFRGDYTDANVISSVKVSKVKSITALEIPATLTPASEGAANGTWTFELDKSKISESGVSFVVLDNAGNESTTICSFNIDETAPVVTIESPTVSASTVLNGKNTFSGKVEEVNPKSIKLYYVFQASAAKIPAKLEEWAELSGCEVTKGVNNKTVSDVSSWTFKNVDVNTMMENATKGTLYILPVAYDEAGNCNVNVTSVTGYSSFAVDLDSDRPVLKFSNLPWDASLSAGTGGVKEFNKNLQTLTGTINDDDGISELRIAVSDTEITEAPADLLTNDDYKLSVNSGAFSVELGADGAKSLWIYVKDSAGGEFQTAADGNLYQPYLIFDNHKDADNKDIKTNNNAAVNFAINSSAPKIKTFEYKTSSAANGFEDTLTAIGTTNIVGGTSKKYVIFALNVESKVPVKSVKVAASGYSAEYNFTKSGATQNESEIWTSEPVNTSDWDEGTNTLTFTVEDASGLTTVETKQMTTDYTAPSVSITSPKADDVTGEVTLSGITTDVYSDVAKIGFEVVGNYAYSSQGVLDSAKFDDVRSAAKDSVGTLVPVSSPSGWSFTLDGIERTVAGVIYKNPKLPASEAEVENSQSGIDKAPLAHPDDAKLADVRKLTIVFYVEDSLGNCTCTPISESEGKGTPITINYNPYGDRPESEISYPSGVYTSTNYVEGYSNINGSIRVTGSASDNNSISEGKVFIQLDVNKDGKFDDTDKTLLAGAGYTIIDDITDSNLAIWSGKTINPSAITYHKDGEPAEAKWGIPVNGTNSWSITLNSKDELKKISGASIGDNKYKIGVRSVAVDSSGVFGKWGAGAYFMIDDNAPQISKSEIVNTTGSENVISKKYDDDMYLSGIQWLKVTVKDKIGIRKLTYKLAGDTDALMDVTGVTIEGIEELKTADSTTTADSKGVFVKRLADGTGNDAGYVLYDVYIPVSSLKITKADGRLSLALKLTVFKDADSELSTYERYALNFDEKKPEIDSTKGITFNGVKANASGTAIENKIVNSNGSYFTLGGKIKDEGAGFERIAFYYYRDAQGTDGHKRRVFDPDPSGTVGEANRKVQVTADSSTSLASGINMVEVEDTPLYGYDAGVSISSDGLTVTLSSDNVHIRAGGLVQINNVWHLISAKSGTTLTLATATTATSATSAFFPIAQVIDNLGAEKTDADGNLLASESGDDGDGMPESVVKAGTYWTFDASIHSNYIPDGPGTLVMFIWDKAGNVEVVKYNASVQNNAPRLTKLWLGTALSGNYSESNFTEYDVLTREGSAQSSYEMATASYGERFRVKGDLAVVAEFTGGNNASNSTDDSRIKMVYSAAGDESTGYKQKDSTGSNMYTSDSTLSAKTWFKHSSADLKNFAFSIPQNKLGDDSTLLTNGKYSERKMSFTFWDDTDETTQGTDSCFSYLKITDFIVMINDTVEPKVVVEPFFWKNADDNSLYQNSSANGHIEIPEEDSGDKPAVSGKISIRGWAFDEHTLDSIWIKFTDFTPASGLYSGDADEDDYYKVAAYSNGTWTSSASSGEVEGSNWKFTVTPEYLNQTGHKVKWQLDIDTSAITNAMGEYKSVSVRAIDSSEHTSSEGAEGTEASGDDGYNNPIYTMDVVPYISAITNDEAGSNPINRSRLGRYPVRAGQTIYLQGFNFGPGAISVTRHKSNVTGGLGSVCTSDAVLSGVTRISANTISVKAPDYSGFIQLAITATDSSTAMKAKNNENNNTAGYNIEEGFKAKEVTAGTKTYGRTDANNKGTNFWTDDRYLSVWNSGESFVDSPNPISGTVAKLSSTTKKWDAADSNRGRSGYTENTLYAIWGGNDNMMYDEVFAPAGTSYANTRCYTLMAQASAGLYSPPSETDTVIVNDQIFHAWLDDGWKDSGTFGGGIQLVRDGETPASSSSYIELTKDDMVRHQFKNIKIAGAYSGNKYHMYVTYYDSYTKCLKYGKFLFKNGWDQNRSVETSYRADAAGSYVIDGYDAADNSSISWDVGEYSAIKIDNSGTEPIPVVAYYDKQNKKLKIARGSSSAPVSKRYGGTIGTGADETPWTYTSVTSPAGSSDFGRYVSMEMDNSGNLHIAAQDVTNGKLYYGMFTKSGNSYEISDSWVAVDSTSSVGRWNDIKLENYAGNSMATCKPVITYQDASRLNTTSALKIAYVDANGSWEAMTSPSVYEAQDAKLSTIVTAVDKTNKTDKYAIGFNSTELAVDFLRGEQ